MDFSFSEDQHSVRDLAARIFTDTVDDSYHRHFQARGIDYDAELWQVLAQAGLSGLCIDEQYGGSGLDFTSLCLMLEEQGRVLAPLPTLWSAVCGALPLQRFAPAALCRQWLPGAVSGESHLTAALQEVARSGGSPFSAQPQHGGWRLEGESQAVPYAGNAAAILVPAMNGGELQVFAVPGDAQGVEAERQQASNREPYYRLRLDGVRLDEAQRLTGEAGPIIIEWILQRAWTALSALQLGVLEEALRRTAQYVGERRQFGRPIAAFQAVSHRAANAYIDCEALRSSYWQAAWQLDEDRDAGFAARSAKWWACEAGHRVSHSCQHLHGGIGSDVEYPIHRYYLWAKQLEFALGGARQLLADGGAQVVNDERWRVAL